ncbi:MAG TPA: peptidyl-prolyl cis-trans isomerase [Nocardioides sp.]|nr:peptidyl-prolyl cis-trans isomerase [Nocardioides sp.]
MPDLPNLTSMPRQRLALASVVVVLVAAVGGTWWVNRGLPDDVAVRVGSTDVSVAELRGRMATVEALYGVTAPDDGKAKDGFWRDAAHSVAVGLVLADAAKDEDVSISGNEVDQSLQQVITSFFGEGEAGQAAFTKALATAGTSEDEVRDELRRQLEVNALFAAVTSDVESPTTADVAAAYDQRRCSLRLPEKRQVRNIVVATRADAQDVLRRLRGGASFASVAAATTIDGSTRDAGGDLGLVAATDLETGYAEAAFAVRKGQLFGPVQGAYGWNVGRVDAIAPGRIPTLEQATAQLKQVLFAEGQSEVWRAWLRKRLEAADVEYGDAYAPEDPLALPTEGLPGTAADDDPAPADC